MRNRSLHRARADGFSLVELLVVMTIICILMAVAFAAYKTAMDTTFGVKDLNTCTNLAQAVNAYETEYGVLPIVASGAAGATDGAQGKVESEKDWVTLATALNSRRNLYTLDEVPASDLNGLNPRGVVYFTFPRSEVTTAGAPKSAFHNNGDQLFVLRMDANYDNIVDDVADLHISSGAPIRAAGTVFVWSKCANTTGPVDQKRWKGTQK